MPAHAGALGERSVARRTTGVMLVTTLLVGAPSAGWACPVCFTAANPGVLHSYYGTAVAMTALPLLLVAGFAIWLRRHLHAEGPGGVTGDPATVETTGGGHRSR